MSDIFHIMFYVYNWENLGTNLQRNWIKLRIYIAIRNLYVIGLYTNMGRCRILLRDLLVLRFYAECKYGKGT